MRTPEKIFPIGTKVCKLSGKPFKSGNLVNTVTGIIDHPYKINPDTGKGVPAYTFKEDCSFMEAAGCREALLSDTEPNLISPRRYAGPKEFEGWVNIFITGDMKVYSGNNIYATEEEAKVTSTYDKMESSDIMIDTIKISWSDTRNK